MFYLGLAFVLGSAFMTWKAVQLWRNADLVPFFMDTFAFLPFGEEARRGEVRSIGLTTASLWGIAVLFFVGLGDGDLSGPALFGSVAALGLVLVCVLCEICVVLFNVPKFVVPPHMRAEPGVIAARRARRSADSNSHGP
ncbi:hypothetical protein [Streptomyces sp. AC1-42W]|uniref:hypothetical protein n=1 Tax=Streptomyces sp. AC1-42W TaxID=2218666 RepID=UPI000DAB9E79|nr:hypothetical protein [Streptomyces sp. AC1-42W]PZT77889.1 hypothetical protein DNK56_32725 [Streptomyces sp. AC1-42W]